MAGLTERFQRFMGGSPRSGDNPSESQGGGVAGDNPDEETAPDRMTKEQLIKLVEEQRVRNDLLETQLSGILAQSGAEVDRRVAERTQESADEIKGLKAELEAAELKEREGREDFGRQIAAIQANATASVDTQVRDGIEAAVTERCATAEQEVESLRESKKKLEETLKRSTKALDELNRMKDAEIASISATAADEADKLRTSVKETTEALEESRRQIGLVRTELEEKNAEIRELEQKCEEAAAPIVGELQATQARKRELEEQIGQLEQALLEKSGGGGTRRSSGGSTGGPADDGNGDSDDSGSDGGGGGGGGGEPRSKKLRAEPPKMVKARLKRLRGGGSCDSLLPEQVGQPPNPAQVNPDEVSGDVFCELNENAYPFARTRPWYTPTNEGQTTLDANDGLETLSQSGRAWIGKDLEGGPGTTLYVPYDDFMADVRGMPIVQMDNLHGPTFSGILSARPAAIRLVKSGTEKGTQNNGYLQPYFSGRDIFEVEGFVRIPDEFLELKAEAMQIVKGVSSRAMGIDNKARAIVSRESSRIVSNAIWTFADLRPEALASAASLFRAAQAQLSLRGDMGKSWRNSSTVQSIDRTAKAAALDFIREQFVVL